MSFADYLAKKRQDDQHYMRIALAAAEKAKSDGDVPVGAVIAWPAAHMVEYDTTYSERDVIGHAILNVLRKASQTARTKLHDAVLYCTVEPCPMCAHAAAMSGVREIVFGAYDLKEGVISTGRMDGLGEVAVKGGVLAAECAAVLPRKLQEHIVEASSGKDVLP